MSIKREVAYGIVRGLSEFWKSEEFQDFTVTVGSTQFGCHKFLLAACSGFFQGLFRSKMKENICKSATLEGMSSDTFELIVETMYTGHGVLTNDNVIDIWHAASQLQITFLMEECDLFVMSSLSLDNYDRYQCHAKLLNRRKVLEKIWTFIQHNFDSFSQSESLLDLSVDKLLELVKCQDLKVTSEDVVVKSILRWVDHDTLGLKSNDNNSKNSDTEVLTVNKTDQQATEVRKKRSDYLDTLLSAARTFLVSTKCLEQLMKLPIILENIKTRKVILKAMFYNMHRGYRHGQWPSSAIWRNYADSENVAVTCVNNFNMRVKEIQVYSFTKNKWFRIDLPLCQTNNSICLNIDNTLNVLVFSNINRSDPSHLHLSSMNIDGFDTKYIGDILTDHPFAEVVENDVYIMTSTSHKFYKWNTLIKEFLEMDIQFETDSCIQLTATFLNYILIFCTEPQATDTNETAVQCFDTVTQTMIRLNNLEGQSEKLISFRNDHNTFILQTNGDLWKVVQFRSDVVDFEFVAKLWSCDWSLHGAVTYLNDLYIYGVKSESHQTDTCLKRTLSGYFHQIVYLESDQINKKYSGFVPAVYPRKLLLPNL